MKTAVPAAAGLGILAALLFAWSGYGSVFAVILLAGVPLCG